MLKRKRLTESTVLTAVLRRLLRDQDRDPLYLSHRESSVRATLPEGLGPREALRHWAEFFEGDTIERHLRRERIFFAVCFLVGILFGVLAANGVVWLDVPAPANVLLALLVLVALPLLLLVLSLLFVMPAALWRRIPVLGSLAEWASPTLVMGLVSRLNVLTDSSSMSPLAVLPAPARERFVRWSAVMATQTTALGFGIGSILSILFTVSVTDVAFVWSTTLAVDPESFYSIVRGLSLPWAGWLPEAVPTYTLIEETRFYRMKTSYADPKLFGAWWTFLLASLLFYSVLPRLVLVFWARRRREAAARSALNQAPGVEALLRRLLNPSPLAEQIATERPGTENASIDAIPLPPFEPERSFSAVVWAAARDENLLTQLRGRFSSRLEEVYLLGGLSEFSDDERMLTRIVGDKNPLVLFVRGWEPPTAELVQTVQALANRRASPSSFKVVLLPLVGANGAHAVTQQQQRVWRGALPQTITVERMCDA